MDTVWVNGRLLGADEPAIAASDLGILRGYGAFETCRLSDGRVLALDRHLRRLNDALTRLHIPLDGMHARVEQGIDALLALDPPDGRLRITVTAGTETSNMPTVTVATSPHTPSASARVVRSRWVRNERSPVTGIKTISYVDNVLAHAEALAAGADEAILANTVGELAEGTMSNVFVEIGGELLTPPLSSGCLPGITRELILEAAAAQSLPVREARPGELPYGVLDEVSDGKAHLAVTSTGRGLQPVEHLDGTPVTPGPIMAAAREAYLALALSL